MDRLDWAGVTKREREVLVLLSDRLTNSEIADKLYISVRTVESHVSSLLTKLGVDNRRALGDLAPMARRRGFPVPHTSFVGRDKPLSELRQRIDTSRLVTVTGVAGSGKTRLAIELGNRITDRYRDGAVFVDLVPIRDPFLVHATVAKAIGITTEETTAGTRKDEIIAYLGDRQTLLILDNCEQVIDGVIELVESILPACPEVVILATSRQGFAIPGEYVYVAPSLDLPDEDTFPEAAESVQLLIARLRAIREDIDLLRDHRQPTIEICRRLDGLPLSIELAAVQMAHLSPEEVVARLDDRFHLLVRRHPAGAPLKSTALRAAIDWSYDLLSHEEAVLFDRLGAFVGTFSLEAASVVGPGDPIGHDDIADLIGSLVWNSLVVVVSPAMETRYRLPETLSAYAREHLNADSMSISVWERFCAWAIDSAEDAASHLLKADAGSWLRRLDRDLDNLRAALRWALDNGRTVEASRLVFALWRYWHMRGDLAEGRRWVAETLALGGEDPSTRARTLEAAGGLAWWAGEIATARDHYEEALTLLRDGEVGADVANALYNAALTHGLLGDTERAFTYYEESRHIYESLGDRGGVAKCLWGWGTSAQTADRLKESRPAFEQALAIYQGLDDTFSLAWTHHMLGLVLLRLGEPARALPHINAGLRLFTASEDLSGINLHLRDFCQIALDVGEPERALVIAGALSALEEETGLRLRDAFSMQIEGLETARDAVGEERARSLIGEGRVMSRNEILDYVMGWNPSGLSTETTSP